MQGLIKDIKRLRETVERSTGSQEGSVWGLNRRSRKKPPAASCTKHSTVMVYPRGRSRSAERTPREGQENLGPLYLRMRRTDSNFPTLHTLHYVFYTQWPALNKKKKKLWYARESKKTQCQESTVNWWKPRYGTDGKWSDWDFKVTIPMGQQQQSSSNSLLVIQAAVLKVC